MADQNQHMDNFAVAVLAVLMAKDQEPTVTHINKAMQLLNQARSCLEAEAQARAEGQAGHIHVE